MDEAAAEVRSLLDADGVGDELFKKLRAKESEDEGEGEYRVILLGSLMMLAGARIRPDDLQHLRKLVPKIHCSHGYALPLWDSGFRGPGRAQFLAALDHYQPGVPRDFVGVPSCFHCGRIKADTGRAPCKCTGCKRAWYCGKVGQFFLFLFISYSVLFFFDIGMLMAPWAQDCQKAHWKLHKPSCAPTENRSNAGYISLNV